MSRTCWEDWAGVVHPRITDVYIRARIVAFTSGRQASIRSYIVQSRSQLTIESRVFEVSGLEDLFRIASSSNYMEVDINICNPAIDYYHFFIKHMFWARKRNVSNHYVSGA